MAPISLGPLVTAHLPVVARVKSPTRITLDMAGSDLARRCRAYPNDTLPSGIVRRAPDRYPTSR